MLLLACCRLLLLLLLAVVVVPVEAWVDCDVLSGFDGCGAA